MKLGTLNDVYDEWEDEHGIPFNKKFEELPSLDEMPDEVDTSEMTTFEQLALKELDEIRQLLKEKK